MNTIKRILVLLDNSAEMEKVAPCFADLPFGWKAYFSGGEDDALRQIADEDFEMVFVDLSAGPFAGVEFLNGVWNEKPATKRFLLGNTPTPELMTACALGAHQFLQKPLSNPEVRSALERGAYIDSLLQERPIQRMVSRIRTFPARPTVYLELMRELRSVNASAQTVGELVSQDFAISTKLIQLINSAAFGLSQPVSTPEDAVLLLGMETTASLVLGIEAFSRLDKMKPMYFAMDRLWSHSQTIARYARQIAEKVTNDRGIARDAYTAGLLHDIGKLALSLNLEGDYKAAVNAAHEKNLPLHEVEKEMLGATHAEAGAYLLAVWGLPGGIVEGVARHHQAARHFTGGFTSGVAVHLANAMEGAKNSIRCGVPEFRLDLNYPERLGLQEHFDSIREIVSFPPIPVELAGLFEAEKPARGAEAAAEEPLPENPWFARWFGA